MSLVAAGFSPRQRPGRRQPGRTLKGAAIAWAGFAASATENLRRAAADPAAAIAADLDRLTGCLEHLARQWHKALWT